MVERVLDKLEAAVLGAWIAAALEHQREWWDVGDLGAELDE